MISRRANAGERCARESLEQKTQGDESEIAVDDSRAGRVLESLVSNCSNCGIALTFGQQVERTPRGQSRSVRQQLAHRDRVFVRAIEFRQIVRDRAVQGQFAQLNAAGAEQTR